MKYFLILILLSCSVDPSLNRGKTDRMKTTTEINSSDKCQYYAEYDPSIDKTIINYSEEELEQGLKIDSESLPEPLKKFKSLDCASSFSDVAKNLTSFDDEINNEYLHRFILSNLKDPDLNKILKSIKDNDLKATINKTFIDISI